MANQCDTCANRAYDEEEDDEICNADMDEDEYCRFVTSPEGVCPYYRSDNEYEIVRHQM